MRVSRGAGSGQVLRTSVVAEPAPMVFTRQRPAPGDRVVALTFDDGPWPGQTEAVLEVLEKADAPATFFMLGVQVVAHPDLARAVVDAGHVVGNHTQSHPILRRARAERCLAEIEAAQRTIERATGVDPEWFRPAGGLVGPGLFEAADEASVRVVGWTIDPQDWTGAGADEIAANVLKYLHPGAVILLHDGGGDRGPTIEALPAIIDGIRERGYTLIGMDEYPGAPSPTPTG
jgi:peptidoglycan/xylan/chitin deacetylase (PgdA/CDA1 family)